jgi:5-methylcytosine-specific restriction endonuclease McrA
MIMEAIIMEDHIVVECYLRHHSQTKAAADLGVSRETVARAVRRAGIKLDGREYHNGRNQPQAKITDEQLTEEAKTLSTKEIAARHGMSQERVYRRAKSLGIKIECGGGHWDKRAAFYGVDLFDNSITLSRVIKKYNGICQICGKPVDLSAKEKGHIRRAYPTVDHVVPISKGGGHTWENVQLAHMGCNAGKRDREERRATE